MNTGELIGVIITAAVCALVLTLMAWGWSRRKRRQADIDAPTALPAELAEPRTEAEGFYVVTTHAGQPLERIASHDLGVRCRAALSIGPDGVGVYRTEADNFFIAAGTITQVGTTRGMVGKFVEADGILVIRHSLGQTPVDTGFRAHTRHEHAKLLEALKELAPQTLSEQTTPTPTASASPEHQNPERTA